MPLIQKLNNIRSDKFSKQPWEQTTISINWSDELAGGTILSYSAEVYDGRGVSVGTTILAGLSERGETLFVGIQGGEDGVVYTLKSKVTSSLSTPDGTPCRFESSLGMIVRDTKFY